MSKEQEIARIRSVMSENYSLKQRPRRSPWHPLNPVSLHYRQKQERTIVRLINRFNLPLETLDILDAGCGGGGLLRLFAALGASPARLWGIDLMEERIELAASLSPQAFHLQTGELTDLPYPDHSFDLVSQFTVFSSILDPEVRAEAAKQMLRVLRPGGWLLWYDMHSARTQALRGLPLAEVETLFAGLSLVSKTQLHPQKISWLAVRLPWLAQLAEELPLLPRTHWLLLLQKPGGPKAGGQDFAGQEPALPNSAGSNPAS